jgi:hypothetical protein
MTDQRTEHPPWPMRAALLFGLGALCGLVFDQLIGDYADWSAPDRIPRLALATFVATGGVLFAFTLERLRWVWSLAFALGAGTVLGLIFYWSASPDQSSAYDFWRAFAALLGVAIAAPLFQTMRDEGARRLPYVPVHAHVWSNIVLWCAAWAFVLIAWLLAQLLAALFQLIGIDLLRELMDTTWANWMLIGGTLGGAVGLLRDRDGIVGLLQRVVTTILAMLAPVLAVGLVLFELALPFTGLDKLWDQTRATTPILLICVFGAFILANAVIGTGPEDEAKSPVLRWSAMALGAAMLPLAAVASVSTGLRIEQYGFTPERLWAIVFVAIAAACALLYLYALVRGRTAWAQRIRPTNIRLAIAVCAVALLLATPLADFGAISTRSQLARLDSGAVTPDEFDWRALRFNFGPSGVAALERLKGEGANPEIRHLATAALAAARPWDIVSAEDRRLAPRQNLRVLPAGAAVPDALRDDVLRGRRCAGNTACVLIFEPAAHHAVLISTSDCRGSVPEARICDPEVSTYYLEGTAWVAAPARRGEAGQGRRARLDAAVRQGRVEVREVPRRQVFVDGVPVGDAFE